MSYWSHNPEKYDEICNQGITEWLLNEASFDGSSVDASEVLLGVIDHLKLAYPEIWGKLLTNAQKQVSEVERDYWDSLGDKVMSFDPFKEGVKK